MGIAGIVGALDPNKAPDRNLTKEIHDFIAQLPQILGASELYQPQFADLYNQEQQRSILGSPGGAVNEQYIDYTVVPGPIKYLHGAEQPPDGYKFLGMAPGGNARMYQGPGQSLPEIKTRTINTPPTTGLLGIYEQALPRLTAAQNEAQQLQLGSQVQSYGLYGPQIRQAFANTYPEYNSLLNNLLGSAKDDLAQGYQLGPVEARQLQQNVRGAYSARGLGESDAAAADEAMQQSLAGRSLYQQRLQNAQQISGLYGSSVPNLTLPNIGAPLGGSGALSQLFSQSPNASAYGASMFGNPYNSYSQNLYDMNFGMDQSYNNMVNAIHTQGAAQTAQGAAQLASWLTSGGYSSILGMFNQGGGGGGGSGMMGRMGAFGGE